MTIPVTTPIPKDTAKILIQKSNRRRYTGLPVANDIPSIVASHAASPIVKDGKIMCHEIVKPNWMRDNISGSRLIGSFPDMPLTARSGALEAEDWDPGGNDETVHAGDVLVRVDEQPFPVERYGLDVERLAVWR